MIELGPGSELLHWGADVEVSALALNRGGAGRAGRPVRVRLLHERARGWRGARA